MFASQQQQQYEDETKRDDTSLFQCCSFCVVSYWKNSSLEKQINENIFVRFLFENNRFDFGFSIIGIGRWNE